jgi:hypothetical protein
LDRPESSRPDDRVRERFDLAPEPIPEPTAADTIAGIAEALEAAIDLDAPERTNARCIMIVAQARAVGAGYLDPDELLTSLGRLAQDWRAS